MTDTTTPPKLEIPQAAADEYFACGCSDYGCKRGGYQPDAIPVIVAAELRRLAEVIEPDEPFAASLVRDRADELDPQP